METRGTRSRVMSGVGFVIGTLALFGLIQGVKWMIGGGHEPLIPQGERQVANLNALVLVPGGMQGAGQGAVTQPSTAPAAWRLEDHRGKVVLVNYFATWCPPCLAETPELVEIAREYADRGVVMAALSLDRDEEGGRSRGDVVGKYVERYKVNFPIIVPPPESVLWRQSFPIPQTFLYDREGRRARVIVGAVDGASVRKSLEELLGEK